MQKAETLRKLGIRKDKSRIFQRVKPWSGWRCRTARNCLDNYKREGTQKCGVALKDENTSKVETLREPVSGSGMKHFQHGWTTFWREQTSETELNWSARWCEVNGKRGRALRKVPIFRREKLWKWKAWKRGNLENGCKADGRKTPQEGWTLKGYRRQERQTCRINRNGRCWEC
jgi:hypothetical protein